MEGEDVICPDPVIKALTSHGWVIPTEQQVSEITALLTDRWLTV